MSQLELDNLIKEYLTDGIISPQERRVLLRKAEKMGFDIEEIDLYITAQVQKEANKKTAQKIAESGMRCPKCGSPVTSLTLKCACGHEFVNRNSVSSIQKLVDRLEKINSSQIKGNDDFLEFEYTKNFKERQERIKDTIRMFPVPNTKEDIIEFLTVALTNSKGKKGFAYSRLGRALPATIFGIITLPVIWGAMILVNKWGKIEADPIVSQNEIAEVWRNKFIQVMLKGRSLQGDEEFQRQLDYYENLMNKM